MRTSTFLSPISKVKFDRIIGMKEDRFEIRAQADDFPKAQSFIEDVFKKQSVNKTMASETMLLFEAVFNKISSLDGFQNSILVLKSENKYGVVDIDIAFEGKRLSFEMMIEDHDKDSQTIETYSDKISTSYRLGTNIVKLSVRKSHNSFTTPCLIAAGLAIALYVVLSLFVDNDTLRSIASDYVEPLQKLFTNAVLMIGAPMTLFSVLKNVSDSFLLSERNETSRKMFVTSITSSGFAVVLGGLIGYAIACFVVFMGGRNELSSVEAGNWNFASIIDQIIPSSIIEPFETISPIPMIAVALLIAYALCSIGKSFSSVKRFIDVSYDLFSRMLQAVMSVFPIACFLLFFNILISDGIMELVVIMIMFVLIFFSTIPLGISYAIRLMIQRVNVIDFVKKFIPCFKENRAIGSVISATPYNIRYCSKVFGFPKEKLKKELPVLAQTNLDGNCFILMMITVTAIFTTNLHVSWLNVIIVAIIILFLSLGAPNQPGSILIGILVITTYLGESSVSTTAIYYELICGTLQNLINVTSSIVTVAEFDGKEKRMKAREEAREKAREKELKED